VRGLIHRGCPALLKRQVMKVLLGMEGQEGVGVGAGWNSNVHGHTTTF